MTIDERIASELRRHAPEIDEHTAWLRIESAAPRRRRGRMIRLVSVSAAAFGMVVLGFIFLPNLSPAPGPIGNPQSSFVGTWVTIDMDGSTPIMVLQVSGDDVEMVVVDDYASVCSGAPSTMTGTGSFVGDDTLVFPSPVLTCDDGSQPQSLSGPPLEDILQNLTFTYDARTDTLTDTVGAFWRREGGGPGPDSNPDSTLPNAPPAPTGAGWWPQSNLEEVRKAQELADAGDPDYTWQLDATLAANGNPWAAEIFARFMNDELGWEEFSVGFPGYAHDEGGGMYEEVVFIRCAAGQTNPLNPLYTDAPPEIRRCAPTIDETSYETVRFTVSQPVRRGATGIWVVSQWEMLQPAGHGSLWGLLYPDFSFSQVEQVVPPSEAEVTAFLQEFLGARVDGAGAEQYLLREPEDSWDEDREVPLLYATSSGTPYDRSEMQRLQGPVWPGGWTEYKVRLFAQDGTVVEQYFHVVRPENGQLGLIYGHTQNNLATTENGRSVPVAYNLLDGEVTFAASPPWRNWSLDNPTSMMLSGGGSDGTMAGHVNVVIAADPLAGGTGCETAPVAADAEALARRIRADSDFETLGTAPVRIGGLDGLQMDVVVTNRGDLCYGMWMRDVYTEEPAWRMRLYLIDHPGESARVLTVAVIALAPAFEQAIAGSAPIIDSIEFNAP